MMTKEQILQKLQGVHNLIELKLSEGKYKEVSIHAKTAGKLKHEYNKK